MDLIPFLLFEGHQGNTCKAAAASASFHTIRSSEINSSHNNTVNWILLQTFIILIILWFKYLFNMVSFNAATSALAFMASISFTIAESSRQLSAELIAGYEPLSQVTDHVSNGRWDTVRFPCGCVSRIQPLPWRPHIFEEVVVISVL